MAAVVKPVDLTGSPPASQEALDYLHRCVSGQVSCAVLTAADDGFRHQVLEQFVDQGRKVGRDHWVVLAAPTDSPQTLVEAILAQLGYELQDGDFDTVQSLLTVFLRHEIRSGRRLILVMDQAHEYGPRVLDFLETLLRARYSGITAVTLVLAGSPDLDRVLDSPGMIRLADATRERFDLDLRGRWLAPGARGGAKATRVPAPAGQAAALSHFLVVLLNHKEVRRVPLPPGRLLIGRSHPCNLRLATRWVSRQHALVLVTGGATFIVDLGSTNGTRVNGATIRQRALRPGDVVEIGGFRLRYESAPGA